MCIASFPNKTGISIVDVTTGDFYLTESDSQSKIQDEIYKYMPTEIISTENAKKLSTYNACIVLQLRYNTQDP